MEEVIEYIKNGNLLKQSVPHLLKSVEIVDTLDKAKRFAWEEVYGDEELLWTDIRELEMAEVDAVSYEKENFEEEMDNLDKLLDTFTKILKVRLKGPYQELLDDIVADLHNCAINRALNGKQNNFFEHLFEIYKAGGWPCGWYGNYPEGSVIAYIPAK
ncbi:hypothetical protein [Scopulibacillus cellulosilyticus]|uniref:Cytoplasmic protein n=1 Tax=Scopulibacillus cellulosilyticus TaxID=2665665 RepID=A0ABW2PXQ2_9BACL